jgi:hypothetical protein
MKTKSVVCGGGDYMVGMFFLPRLACGFQVGVLVTGCCDTKDPARSVLRFAGKFEVVCVPGTKCLFD